MTDRFDVSQMTRAQKETMLKELMASKRQKASYYPLSSGQKGLWFLQKIHPESHAYNVPCAFSIHGALDADALERAVGALTARHPILRTVLKTDETGSPLQSVAYKSPLCFKTESIHDMAESDINPFLRRVARKPFDMEHGPLFRIQLFSRSQTQHFLLVTIHHIIFDGSSFPLFVNELMAMYHAERTGIQAELPKPKSSFADYVAWQQDMLSGGEGDAHKAYWLDILGGELPVFNLPVETGVAPGERGCRTVRTQISANLSAQLRKVAADHRVYLFTVLFSAFQVLLYRYSDQDDMITGIPMAGRTRTEFEDLIGYFINMVPIRTRIGEDMTFTELMQQVHGASMGALEHQDYPFAEMVKALRENGWSDTSESPLFRTSFVLQNWARTVEKNVSDTWKKTAEFTLTPLLDIQQEEEFNLALEVLDFDRFQLFFKYDGGLYRQDTIQRMADHFTCLLEAIACDPEQKIALLPLLTPAERQKILVTWNETTTDVARDRGLHELIQDQVEKTPGAPALVFGDNRLTYGEMNTRANQVGRYLKTLGVGPGTRVAVCMDRSVDMVIGLLGILKASGTYVPMDPAYPENRIRYMLDDTKAPVILTETQRVQALPEQGAKVVCLDDEWPEIQKEDDSNLPVSATSEDLAYIIYTSGSTGQPKGVMIRHRGLPNLVQAQIRLFNVKADSRVLQFASLSFDASISEIAVTLCSGAALYLAPKADLMPGDKLAETLTRHAITHVTLPPSALAVMDPEALPGLSTVVSAGEACPSALASLWSKNRTFINAYGPSESTVCASGMIYDGQEGPLPIGRPIDNIQLFILDRHLQPVPVGVAGELHIGGAGLAMGYLNRPDLTREKFIANPFDAGGRHLYKSGDLCRFLPDGNVEFLGRIDHQVKIRGFRIEPGEIEAALREHDRIKDAVVVARENRQLVAYLIPEGDAPAQGELRAFLRERLPEFMIPAPFIHFDAMPLTPNGKIDRKALPAPDPDAVRDHAFAPPETDTQKQLAAIWQEVLKIENPGIHDDFFMLGGHSLLATVAISHIQRAFKVKVPITRMFDFPTISEFSRHLESLLNKGASSYDAIRPVDRKGPLELSFGQQRLWFLDKFEGDNFTSYNVPIAHRVSGALDVSACNRAINEIVRRHEVLRTIFQDPLDDGNDAKASSKNSSPLQVILPELKVSLTLTDIGELPEEEREARARQIVSRESLTPFDLSRGPLIRVLLVRMSAREHLLMLTFHHIVFDGWSVGVFFSEFEQLYAAFALGKPSPLADLDIQYADFAQWQRQRLTGETLAAHLAYWKKQLAGVPLSTELPTDRPRPPVQTYNGDFVRFELAPDLARDLATLSRTSGVTLFMTLYAAFAVLLSKYGAKEDIVIGSPVANRNHVQTEPLIGFFVNTLALRTDLSGNPGFSDLLRRVKQTTLSAYEHQDLPFERLLVSRKLNIQRSMSHSPLFQVMFDLHNAGDGAGDGGKFTTGGLVFSPLDVDFNVAKFDLSLSMMAGEEGMNGIFQYNTDLFDATTIERTVGHFTTLLAGITADPGQRLSELPILPRAETHRLMEEFNDTDADFPDNTLVHRLFEAQACATPDAVAVVFRDEPLTYKALNERANQMARYLKKLGVGPDVLVGVYMERSFELIVGLLGILKAGGAYVPLDPSYPKDRIAYILEDARAPVLLTQAGLFDSLPEMETRPVCMDTDWEQIAREDAGPVKSNALPHHMIWVIYTSGTTGRPKGVMIEHRSAASRLAFWKKTYQLSETDVAIHYRPYSFDGSVEEYLLPLTVGAKFIMAPSNIAVTDNIADYLIHAVEKYRITKINMPPVLLDVFLEELKRIGPEKVKTLHTVISGGDKLTPDIVQKFDALFDRAYLYNTYGPTENTVDSLNWRCDLAQGRGRVLLGKSVSNTRSYILDGYGHLVPIGVPGELVVSGVGLARGYLNRPDLTEAAFISNPFDESPQGRLYKTGDLCRCLADGNIEFLGRIDHQVKIRGFRIELGEIEAVINRHDQVNEAVVIAREDRPGNKQLAAYLTPVTPGSPPAEADVRAFLKHTLPDYMIPAFMVFMDELPLTSNGKIDRKALPAPAVTSRDTAYQPPRTQRETLLAKIWADTLGVPKVGINDNFFSLGGDSIISIRIISKAAERGIHLGVKQMFEHPTVAELARVAGTRRKILAEQGIVKGALPFPPIMESFFEPPCTDAHHFNQYIGVRICETWDAGIVGQALHTILEHHDALRLTFTHDQGSWTAACADLPKPVDLKLLEVANLSHTEKDARPAAMENRVKRLHEEFDLGSGCLLKALLFLTGEKENHLWVIIHHLAVDGVSWRIFMEDFQRLCTALSQGEKEVLPQKTTSFRDWALRLKEYAGSTALHAEKEYWLGQADPLPLPADHSYEPSDNTLEASGLETITLSQSETHTLMYRAPDVYGARMDELLLTALTMAVCRWTGRQKAMIGLEGHGREELFSDVDVSRTMGWFTSLFPVVLDVGNQTELGTTITGIKTQLSDIPHRGIGYGLLRYMAEDKETRDAFNSLPYPEIIFNYFGQLDESFAGDRFTFDHLGFSQSAQRARKNLLDVGGGVMDGALEIGFSYCTKIHDAATIKALAKDFSDTLNHIVQGCLSPSRPQGFVHKDLPQFPELIYLNKGTTGTPVFWMHGGLGGVGAYVKLAQRIQRPFYGIQARGYMTDRSPLSGVREKAAYYLRIIRAVQPQGPYDLGGYSYGGTLAYEVARGLQALGESVASIVMLDSRAEIKGENSQDAPTFSWKEAVLQAVNIALFESVLSRQEKMEQVLIHRNEVDADLDDDAFLNALIENPKALRLFKVKEKALSQVRSIAKAIEKSHTENYTAIPLTDPNGITCHYFRDKSGRLLGDLEPYFSLGDLDETQRSGYWEAWEDHISNFRMIDVNSSNHMAMLTDERSFEEIARVCERLYS